MKFKLLKSEHLSKFQLLNKIEKLKLSTRENKAVNGDSLVFYSKEEKLYLYISNGLSAAKIYLCPIGEDFIDFAVDCNTFTNAFSNFPTEEVQFAFIQEENQLVFGNKKTRVSLKTSKANEIGKKIDDEFFLTEEVQYKELNVTSFLQSIKYTSFSCAPDFEEHPYSSIMFFISKNKFNSQSSDKHRISIYGDKFDNDQSYLINKSQADLSLNFVDKDLSKFAIHKNKLLIFDGTDIYATALELNTFQSVYNGFQKFFETSEFCASVTVPKNELSRSLKFVSNISGSHLFNLSIQDSQLIITSSGDHSGGAADKIQLKEDCEPINVSYLTNHFMRILDMLDVDDIKLNFYQFNGFTICIVNIANYQHMMFPMN